MTAGAVVALAVSIVSTELYAAVVITVAAAAGLAFASVRRPTRLRAARVADKQSALRNRLATAVEILDGRIATELAVFQVGETSRVVAELPVARAFPRTTRRARNAALMVLGAIALLAGAMVLKPLRWTPADVSTPSATGVESPPAQPSPVARESIPPQQLEQLRARSLTEQAALQQLGQQLRATAAAREIGQALERGDAASASALLEQLALDSDQLSQPARQELAGALLNASRGTAALDKSLSAAELNATTAMTRSSYQAARGALQALAAAILESQRGTLSQEQLLAQIQQLERDVAAQTGGNGTDCGVLTDDGEFFQDCSAVGQTSSSGAMGVVSRSAGESPSAGVGEVAGGHGFASSGVDLDPLGQAPTHLNLPVTDVPVDLSASNAQGNGATSDQRSPTVAISHSHQDAVQQPGVPQTTEPVRQEVERTIVGPAERSSVRDYFRSTDPALP